MGDNSFVILVTLIVLKMTQMVVFTVNLGHFYLYIVTTGLYRGGRIYKWDPYVLWVCV